MYRGFNYSITGAVGSYRFAVSRPESGLLVTSELFPTVVAANKSARDRIDLVSSFKDKLDA